MRWKTSHNSIGTANKDKVFANAQAISTMSLKRKSKLLLPTTLSNVGIVSNRNQDGVTTYFFLKATCPISGSNWNKRKRLESYLRVSNPIGFMMSYLRIVYCADFLLLLKSIWQKITNRNGKNRTWLTRNNTYFLPKIRYVSKTSK